MGPFSLGSHPSTRRHHGLLFHRDNHPVMFRSIIQSTEYHTTSSFLLYNTTCTTASPNSFSTTPSFLIDLVSTNQQIRLWMRQVQFQVRGCIHCHLFRVPLWVACFDDLHDAPEDNLHQQPRQQQKVLVDKLVVNIESTLHPVPYSLTSLASEV